MRLSQLASLASLTAAALSISCGSPPPPAAPTTPPAAAPPVAVSPPPDLAATPEPPGLVVFARASKPSEAIKVIGAWTQLPMPGSDEVGTLVAGESVTNLIDLDQPIDFALTLQGREPHGAISAGVRSLDEAKVAFSKYKLVPVENGALRIDGLGKPAGDDKDEADEGEARVCELVPSFGAATTRLICAESEGTLKELAPWLARTAPRLTFPADVHLEVRLAPVRPLVESMRRALPMLVGAALGVRHTGVPELDETFRAVIDDLADFTSDADTIAIDAMLGEPQGTVTLTTQFRSSTSMLARLAVAHPERAGAPPASFWKLPADADSAYFQGGIDAADFEHARDHLAGVLGGVLGKAGMPDPDRKALRDAASHMLDLLTVRSVYAKGLDLDGADKAIAALEATKPDDAARLEAERVAEEKMAGWFVVGVDAPAAKLAAMEKEWAAAWARPGVAKWVRSKTTGGPPLAIKMAPLPKGITGKDAAHLEVVVYPDPARAEAIAKKGAKKPAPGKPLVLHALVVPDGNASWLVFAAEESVAVARAKELLASGAGGLAARPGLAAMKDARMNAGGFISPRAFAVGDVFGWTLAPTPWRLHDSSHGALAATPDHGTTPILFQVASQPAGGASPAGTLTATATIPKGAIESIVRMAMH